MPAESALADIDIGRSGKSSKVGEKDRKLTRVRVEGLCISIPIGGESSTRQMEDRSNRAGKGVLYHLDSKSRSCSDIDPLIAIIGWAQACLFRSHIGRLDLEPSRN